MRRFLFVMEHKPGMGESSSGTVQRSEHLINALTQIGNCDVFVINTYSGRQVCVDALVAWLGDRGNVFVCDEPMGPLPLLHRAILRLARLMGCAVLGHIFYAPSHAYSNYFGKLLFKNKYDLIVCRYLRSAIQTGVFRQKNLPVVLDLDDDPLEVAETKNREDSILPFKISWWLIKQCMQRVFSKCAHVWVVKSVDARSYECSAISVLPNIPVFPQGPIKEVNESSRVVLFVGLLHWAPNTEGLAHFITRVWPEVSAKREDAILRVVGGGANNELRKLMADVAGVEYMGWQKLLTPCYEAAKVCVCPVYEGAGSKIKVLEALAHRRPVVLTQHAYVGVKGDLCDGQDLLVSMNDSDFSKNILNVLASQSEAKRLAQSGYATVMSKFSEKAFFGQVTADVDSIFRSAGNNGNLEGLT